MGNEVTDAPAMSSAARSDSDCDRGLGNEVYSFVSLVASIVAFFAWLVWVLVPDAELYAWGITYYPDKWWSLALPAYLVTTLAFIAYTYVVLNMLACCPPDSVRMFKDPEHPTTQALFGNPGDIPDIVDIVLAVINGCLFPNAR